MSDAVWFVLVFGGLFILRGVAATIVFLWILPEGDRCPQCDAETLRLEPTRWSRLMPRLRRSWCLVCGWHGVHRETREAPNARDPRSSARQDSQMMPRH
jgi:hypothetical protein